MVVFIMGKTYSLKLNDSEVKNIDNFLKKKGQTPSDLLRKALWQYINEVNQKVNPKNKEKKHINEKKVDLKVNPISENNIKKVKQVNHPIRIVNDYELLRHYKEEIDWLRNRIEYFEKLYKDIYDNSFSKTDIKKKPIMSGIRM